MGKYIKDHVNSAFALAVVAAFCGGLVPVAAKVALEVFHPFTVITLRFFFASLFLLPFVYKSQELKLKFFKRLFGVALIGALNPILLFIALPFTKASVSPLIYACIPALTVIYLYITKHRTVSPKQILGIMVGLIGVIVVILLPMLQQGHNFAAFEGNVLILAAAVAFMLYGIVSKKEQQEIKATPLALTFYFSVVTFCVSVPFTVGELLTSGLSPAIGLSHILSVFIIGIVGTGIFYLSYQYALKLESELAAALFTYLQPIATIGLAAIFLGERVTFPFIIGGILSVVGARIAVAK